MPESTDLFWLVLAALVVLGLLAVTVWRDWRVRCAAIEVGQPTRKANLRFASRALTSLAIWPLVLAAAFMNAWWLLAAIVIVGGSLACWVLAERQPDETSRPTRWGRTPPRERQLLRQQEQAVARLLDAEWDPCGVYVSDERPVPGEYESFAWEVLAHLRRGDSEADITLLLTELKAQRMGLGPGPEDRRAARALVDWFQAARA